ncbi:MAG TPA: Ig-like domain-containing protein [Pseudolabrys sp.]|nr:Ig-like domain-containing protein [Pseudolabrys sp.]
MTVTVTVSNSSELLKAIAGRTADTVIILNPGNYGDVTINGGGSSLPITLQAASSTSASTFTSLTVNQANGVTLSGLTFAPSSTNGSYSGYALDIEKSSNVVVKDSSFIGGSSAFKDNASGILVSDSSNVVVDHNVFTGLANGGMYLNSSNITITNNNLTNLRSDGFQFAAVTKVEVAYNNFSDFHPTASDHPDGIQFMSVGTKTASSNVSIHDNVMTFTSANPSQGIFFGDEAGLGFSNISIQDNYIATGYPNGISIINASGLNVSGNTVVASDANVPYKPGIHVIASSSITVNSNVTTILDIDSSKNGTVSGNQANYIAFTSDSNVSNVNNTQSSGMFTASNTPNTSTPTSPTTPTTPTTPDDSKVPADPAPSKPNDSGSNSNSGSNSDSVTKVDTKIVSFSQDSGVKGDGITNDNRIDLQGTAAAKSTVKIYDGTKQIGTATADSNGNWSYTTPVLSDGAHKLAALGANGSASSVVAITVDTKAPVAPTIKSFSPDTDKVGDGATSAHAITLKGTAEANSTVTIYDGSKAIGTATALSNGSWSFDATDLATGSHAFTATATDLAGNASGASSSLKVAVTGDSGGTSGGSNGGSSSGDAVVAPNIAGITPDTNIAHDGVTSAKVLTLQGHGEANSVLKIFDGNTQIGTAKTDASGAWSYKTGSLADGDHSFKVMDTDGASAGATSSSVSMTVDTVAPHAPTMSTFTPSGTTSVNKVVLGGKAEADSLVKIYDGDAQIGTATAKSDGSWSFTSGSLANGNHNFSATSTDAAGNVSEKSVAYVTGTFGSDVLKSNAGVDDILIGGPGSDTFHFGTNFGNDIITDFVATGSGHDVLSFSKDVFSSFADALAHAQQVQGDVVFTSSTNDTLTLKNVQLSHLQKVDFAFS